MSSFIDQFRDTFRKWLGISLGDIDRKLKADQERAAEVLDERAAALLGEVYRAAGAKFERRMAEHKKQFDEAEPLTFDGVFEEIPAPAALAAPAKPEPETASATPPQAAAPVPGQAAPVQSEQRATPKAKKKPASVKKAAEAPASAVPTEPPAPEEAAPSPKMDDAALAAAILKQNERREAGKRNKA